MHFIRSAPAMPWTMPRQVLLLCGTALFAAGLAMPAGAQTPPAIDALIESLRPEAGLTRGIRMPTQPAPAGIAVTPAPAAAAAGTLAATTAPPGVAAVSLTVHFASGSAALTPDAGRVVEALARALASPQLAPFRFRIEGHTDTVGSRPLNQSLSERRAQSVRDVLIQRHGIAPARLEAIGLGEQQLLVPTADEMAESRNRRVQILNLGG
jgi:outer membrane protein OmpA-like peptidoglycan-associated protein